MIEPITTIVDQTAFLSPKKEYKKEKARKQYYTRNGHGVFSLTYHKIEKEISKMEKTLADFNEVFRELEKTLKT